MAIIDNDGFMFLDGLSSEYIVVESNRLDDYIKYINKHKICAIYICSLYYFDDNVDFLKECEHVEKINITSTCILNYYGLSYLEKLKVLLLPELKGIVDLNNNQYIEELSIEMNREILGLNKLKNLKTLRLWKYKPKSKNLTELKDLKSIENLKISQSTIQSLNGCEELDKLKSLELSYLSKLESIEEINRINNSLKTLEFVSCKKIKDHECVECLSNLEVLAFNECGEIGSISFIKNMSNLESFVFMGTNIVDGDLSPCIGIKYVAFQDKKHYSHKYREFNI